jgi:hypothetical protein
VYWGSEVEGIIAAAGGSVNVKILEELHDALNLQK